MRMVRRAVVVGVLMGVLALPAASEAAGTPTRISSSAIAVDANDLVYDPTSDTMWASVGSGATFGANSVVPIGRDGSVGTPILVGSEPNRLALADDGSYLYVGLDGAGAVRRVNLASRVADLQWSLGADFCGTNLAADIAVMPGQPETVAVSRGTGCSPSTSGVVVFDAGVPRPDATPDHTGPYLIAASDTVPDRIYGYNNQHTGFGTYKVAVTAAGATVIDERSGLLEGFVRDIFFDGGLLSDGTRLIDAEQLTLLGTLPSTSTAMVIDADAHRVYGIDNGGFLNVFDTTTFTTVDSFELEDWDDDTYSYFSRSLLARFDSGPFVTKAGDELWLFDPSAYRGAAGEYTPLTPQRVLDTRTGVGAGGAIGPVGPATTLDVQVGGVAGVPVTGVDSVVLNATAAAPTEHSYLTVWPAGAPRPEISNLNYAPSETRANLVTVGVGAGGKISLFNERGSAHVILDVVGYYSTSAGTIGGRFRPLAPQRLFDTRSGGGGVPSQAVGAGATLRFDVTGAGGVPASGVTAVAMNVTAVGATANSYVTVWPDDALQPNASNINFAAGSTVANLVIMRVPESGIIDFFNESGQVHLLADVVGYYTSDRSGESGRYVSFWPERLFDTRAESPFDPPGDLWPGDALYFDLVDGPWGAYVLNVTVTETKGAGYVSVHPWPGEAPGSSSLNYADGVTVPNAVIVRTGPGFAFTNYTGTTHLIADVFGAFTRG